MTKKTDINTWTHETRQMIKLARWVSDRGATRGQQQLQGCGQADPLLVPALLALATPSIC
eukprot:scaffold21174_cov52-Phaeocystis_antarctica.AAC.1